MFHWFGVVTNTKGDSLPNWQVECVQLADGVTVVPIYADENLTPILTTSGIADRAKSDSSGNYDFFVPEGTYSLRFYDANGVFQRLQRYLPMYGNAPEAAIAAMEDAQAAQAAAEVAQGLAEDAQAAAEAASELAQTTAGGTVYATWADLAAATGMTAGDSAVVFEDAGTHTDPVVGGTVANAGIYIYSASPAGWERVADTEAVKAADSAVAAEVSADAAALSAATAEAASGPTYASTALGLAATTSGQAFAVDAGGGLVSVYLNSAGSAVLQRTIATTAALAATGGADLIGSRDGLTLQGFIDRTGTSAPRNVADLLQPMADASGLTSTVVLKKLRADYNECAIYRNSVAGGLEWDRFLFTSRFNTPAGVGLPRHTLTTVAGLYTRTSVARATANNVSETRAVAATVSKTSADATSTGTWSTPATVLTTTDVSWSSTVGDKKEWTITGVSRIEARVLLAGNGGIGKATVSVDGGAEISESLYLLPAGHLINFISTATGNTTMHFPLAEGLDPGTTYRVKIEVDASNPGSNRVYTAGLKGFPAIEFDDVGTHGLVLDATLGGVTGSMSIAPGTRIVKQLDNVTKADWRYIQTSVGSIATLLLYDSTGTLIETTTLDQYASGSSELKAAAGTDQTKGTYYLHIINGKTKNASATAYRIYDVGAYGYDQTTAGIPGTDVFDNNDMPDNISNPNATTDWALIANGNLEFAAQIRKTTDLVGAKAFVGGIHGHETLNSITYYADGVVFDYAGASAGTTFTAEREFKIVVNTTLNFPSGGAWATLVTEMRVNKFGYFSKTIPTTLADCIAHDDYMMMLNVPNTQTGGGTWGDNQGGQTGGGFELAAMNGNYTLNNYDGSGPTVENPGRSMAFVNDKYAVLCTFTTTPELPDLFFTDAFRAGPLGLFQDRVDNTAKGYIRTFSVGGNGETIPSGTTWTVTKHYRTFKGDYRAILGLD